MCVGERYQKEEEIGKRESLQNGWGDRAVNFPSGDSAKDGPAGPAVACDSDWSVI